MVYSSSALNDSPVEDNDDPIEALKKEAVMPVKNTKTNVNISNQPDSIDLTQEMPDQI